MKYRGFLKPIITKITAVINPSAVLMSVSPMLMLGAFSFDISNIDEGTPMLGSYDINAQSVQSIDLLSAPLNPNFNYSIGGAEIEVVDSSALVAENNPSGAGVNRIQNKTDEIRIYVVREGDSLSQIAEMFGVSVNTIIWANDINHGSLITPGQKLAILPISGIEYTVKAGDTLSKVVEKYGGNLDEVMEYNNIIDETKIASGDVVIIPNGYVSTPTKYTQKTYVAGGASSYESGYYIRPVRGGVITQRLHGYNAIDLGVPYGTPILASASGEVIISRDSGGWNGGYGNYIVLKHKNGTQTLYSHNSENTVYVGQKVVQGQVIGYIGSTGRSTGPHVHFEVRGARNPF